MGVNKDDYEFVRLIMKSFAVFTNSICFDIVLPVYTIKWLMTIFDDML